MCVIGINRRSPPNCRTSMTPPIACITLPAERNSRALKNACVIKWNIPAPTANAGLMAPDVPSAMNMYHPELAHGRVREDAFQVGLPK